MITTTTIINPTIFAIHCFKPIKKKKKLYVEIIWMLILLLMTKRSIIRVIEWNWLEMQCAYGYYYWSLQMNTKFDLLINKTLWHLISENDKMFSSSKKSVWIISWHFMDLILGSWIFTYLFLISKIHFTSICLRAHLCFFLRFNA